MQGGLLNKEVAMELKDYFEILWRRKWIIICTFLVTVAAVVIGTRIMTPIYQASTTLRIAASAVGPQNSSIYTYNDQLMNTYVDITVSRPVLDELMTYLGAGQPKNIQAERLPNTELMKITVESTDPKLTATAANTLADILIEQSNQLYTGGGKTSQDVLGEQLAKAQADLDQTRQMFGTLMIQTPAAPGQIEVVRGLIQQKSDIYRTLYDEYVQAASREEIQANMISVVETALVPQTQSQPRIPLNYAWGLIVGLVGGLGLAFVIENLDATLYTTKDIETASKLSVLAEIPKTDKKQIDISQNGSSPLAEGFRKLGAYIQLINNQKSRKVLLVLSAEPGEGKSMVVSNLAYSLAEQGKTVVAIDCNLRLPKLHSLFGLSNQTGLTDVLEQKIDLKDTLQKSQYKNISVLTSGSLPTNPSQFLGSAQMSKLITTLSQQYDYILLDTPALLAVADVAALNQHVDGLILVVRRTYAKRETIEAANKFLAEIQDKVIGLIVNQAEDSSSSYYYQYQLKSGD
jgi:polysaccharide biosynthesis transport protein